MVCNEKLSAILDNDFRKKRMGLYTTIDELIKEGDTVMDFGCGPGALILELAQAVGPEGKVYGIDLQQKMLDRAQAKFNNHALKDRISLQQCQQHKIGLNRSLDVAFCLCVVHEVPDQESLFAEIYSDLRKGGVCYIVEPNFHVTGKKFEKMIKFALANGFQLVKRKKSFLSRSIVLQK